MVPPVPEYQEFKLKHRVFRHIRDGWCAREVDLPDRSGTAWRMFWGSVQPGAARPGYVNAHEEAGEYVEFPTFEACVEWVRQREVRP